jgi:cell wall-associated NlpC family hydrolase
MPRYTARQIFDFALAAGFTPDEAVTFTAIGLAESGGNSRAHNMVGEDSRGIWQINANAHPDLARRYDLYDPVHNARAAFEVSGGGADISPWTVTHDGLDARYLIYKEEAQQAAVDAGYGSGLGVWTGTPGYGHPVAAGGAGDGTGAGPGGGNASLDRFLEVARAQIGDTYVFGAETRLSDANPEVFDCSEFTQWAAHQAGVTIPDGATAQYLHFKQLGMLVPVDEAKNTPGALLFSFDREPRVGDGRTPGAHVAISLGDGRTVEARNSRDDVGSFDAGDRFQYAALIPGISDGDSALAAPVAPEPPATPEPQPLLGGPDTDDDGLTDPYEQALGLDPGRADTDGDNLPDGYEQVVSRTDARSDDTDRDGLKDAFEIPRGLDPTSPDTDRDGHLDGSFAADRVDSDGDGLDDPLELVYGLDLTAADSDADGVGDRLELLGGHNPMDATDVPRQHPSTLPWLDQHDATPVS